MLKHKMLLSRHFREALLGSSPPAYGDGVCPWKALQGPAQLHRTLNSLNSGNSPTWWTLLSSRLCGGAGGGVVWGSGQTEAQDGYVSENLGSCGAII